MLDAGAAGAGAPSPQHTTLPSACRPQLPSRPAVTSVKASFAGAAIWFHPF